MIFKSLLKQKMSEAGLEFDDHKRIIKNVTTTGDGVTTLGELITENLHKDIALLTWIAGMSDRKLATVYRDARNDYEDDCAESVANEEQFWPGESRAMKLMLEALLQRAEQH